MLDGVLGKLNTPKLLRAFDRVAATDKRALRKTIQDFDLDGDGIISKNEMALGFRRLGVSLDPSELDAFFMALDVDGKGILEVNGVMWIMTCYRFHFKLDPTADQTKVGAGRQMQSQSLPFQPGISQPVPTPSSPTPSSTQASTSIAGHFRCHPLTIGPQPSINSRSTATSCTEASSSEVASVKATISARTEAAVSEKEWEMRKFRKSLEVSELDAFSRAYDVDQKLLGALDRMVKELAINKKGFRRVVTEFDLDGDGIISKHEMTIGLQKLGLTLDEFELDAVMRTCDVNQNGTVELNEFIDVMTRYHSRLQLDQTADTEKVGTGRPKQSQSNPCLPKISQPVSKLPEKVEAMSEKEREMRKYRKSGAPLDPSELDALSRAYDVDQKLLGAIDRMVKELAINKKDFKGVVTEFDLDGDGIISKHEMASGFTELGLTLDEFELDAVMRTFDSNQNGTVELNEFIDVMTLYRSRLKLDQTADAEKVESVSEKGSWSRRLHFRGPRPHRADTEGSRSGGSARFASLRFASLR
jgi:Ca2+-binding EF-hand superfamily protein